MDGVTFVLEKETVQNLRQIFKESFKKKEEIGGVFEFELMSVSKRKKIGKSNDATPNSLKSLQKGSTSSELLLSLLNSMCSTDIEQKHQTKDQSEISVVLSLSPMKQQKHLNLKNGGRDEEDNQSGNKLKRGRAVGDDSNGYTLCEVHDDVPFTFHTHPIEVDRRGNPQNIANLISDEDMIGVVQDNFLNNGYLSNIHGKLVFDVLLCPVGIFVYGANQKIVDKWIECEDKIEISNANQLSESLGVKRKKNETTVQWIERIKSAIQWTHDPEKNPFWAEEENALMNDKFNQYIGSWYYTKKKKGFFYNKIISKFSYLGYQFWFQEVNSIDQLDDEIKRCNARWKYQNKWFMSDEFYSIDWKKEKIIQNYLQEMRNQGFFIDFFNWNEEIIKFKI